MDRFLIKSYGLADVRLDWKGVMGSSFDAGVFVRMRSTRNMTWLPRRSAGAR